MTARRADIPPGGREASLAEFARGFDALTERVVRLEEQDLPTVERAIEHLEALVDGHFAVCQRPSRPEGRRPTAQAHFALSFGELRSLVAIVHRDGHGGNWQALGQYGRLLAEAILAHLEEDAGPGRLVAAPTRSPTRR